MSHHGTDTYSTSQVNIDAGLRDYMTQIYREMSISLGITSGVSYFFGRDLMALKSGTPTFLPAELVATLFSAPMIYISMFAPLIMIFSMGAAMRNASPAGARKFLYAFAALLGLSMAGIFVRYTGGSIAQAFLGTSIGFAALSLWGYTTKRDITGIGSFLMVGLVGLIVVMIANIFIQSPVMHLAISVVGLLIFAGFTAYDTQKLKVDYLQMREHLDESELAKMGTRGAMSLYLDFINMFQFLLSLIGQKD